jgi:hypothetical protein
MPFRIPAKQCDSVDADDSQNFSRGHALVQDCNSIVIAHRCSPFPA